MRTYHLKIPVSRAGRVRPPPLRRGAWPDTLSDAAVRPMDTAVPPTARPARLYTVSELTHEIQGLLEQAFAVVWIEGEVSEPKYHSNGHLFFTLKDATAGLRAVVWRTTLATIPFTVEHGLQVVCCGRISVFAPQGTYQLYVETIEPKGRGALQLAFEQLCARLEQEGLFAPARKRPLPAFPQRVGIVTSPTGAAIEDLLRILRGHVAVLLYPTRVQGAGAAEQIARGIVTLNRCDDLDVLLIGRGGGSLEDLWAFNEEVVARAIVASRLPVISAVGHEKDVSVADLVADARAPTPTKGAELLVAQRRRLLQRFGELLATPAFAEPGQWLADRRETLEGAREALTSVLATALGTLIERVRLAHARAWQGSPQALVEQHTQRLGHLRARLQAGMARAVERALDRTLGLVGQLHALSPLAVLARGYSITCDATGQIVRAATQVVPGAMVRTRLAAGALISRVERTMEDADGEDWQTRV